MGFVDFIRAVAALGLTLGLIGLAAWAMRKYGPEWLLRIQMEKKQRRLVLVETLPLDPTRRLVLVRLDDEERLIMIGEGRLLATQPAPPPIPEPEPEA
ncbi:flagellar biosynthetic protein FliO [Caulobacter sp. NIBR2454]|uniref:flagellar biosynthetic protein FliO n=1 Tax=Caulobacter sp. NIBR2454 TaxID=3015996 RepID=UPI0022B61634|nr:flagellar biosynthetic protein FliO [Caulobacter sp. NIBR2454]